MKAWLMEGDPAIRWQALRDLSDAAVHTVAAERARVAHEGLGGAILALQQGDGSWRREGRPVWLPTLFSLLLLRATGVDPADVAVMAAIDRLEGLAFDNADGRWELRPAKDRSFFAGEEEPCINGGVLALGGYFGRPSESLARRLLGEQLADGGWNCEAPKSLRSSFHSTMCVLEGLLAYEVAVGGSDEIAASRRRGEEYLLQRSLFRRQSDGEVADAEFLELAFPPRYHHDVLRGLDYFRGAYAEKERDPRLREAVEYVASRRQFDGRWVLDRAYEEGLPLSVGEALGLPSRWNTLRAVRVLRWWGDAALF